MIAEMSEFDKKVAEVANRAYADIVEHEQNRCLKIVQPGDGNGIKPIDISDISLEESEAASERVLFGLEGVDSLFSDYENGVLRTGLSKQEVVVLAGMSGYGKTTLALTMFANLYRRKIPAIFFSFDMDERRTKREFRHALIGFNGTANEYMDEIQIAGYKPPLACRQGDQSILAIDATLTKNPASVIFIDYIDYVVPTGVFKKLEEKLKALMSQLKELAIKHNCGVILLSQCREDKNFNSGRPTLLDIYGGREVRSKADQVLVVYRNSKHNSTLDSMYKNITEIKNVKPRGFLKDDTTYVNYRNGRMFDLNKIEIDGYKEAANKKGFNK